ncbi:hypothetical protein [Rubrivirga sp. IMCC45206]|uniref:hypothetical protein n=1 Tax=Rubrivirga sp. IMCC45206 TaxID=3391614 RepID=UPI00398FE9D5
MTPACARLEFIPDSAADFLFVEGRPRDGFVPLVHMTEGLPIADRYPPGPDGMRLHLTPTMPGLRPGSFVGNTGRLVILHRDALDALAAEVDLGPHEVLPLTIVDHKGRDHTRDYVLFSPIGSVDALNEAASEIRRYPDGTINRVVAPQLQAEALAQAPDVFRLAREPRTVLFSGRAVAAAGALGLTNLMLIPVEVR